MVRIHGGERVNMNKIDEEFNSYDKTGSWAPVYQKIRQDCIIQHDFSVKDAKRAEFKGRNRYRDVSPYDHSRVRLDRDNVDYINASLVEYPSADRSYILTQGPLPNTSSHFWLMVWEQNTAAVLMLNRVVEMGRVKCHQYFPMSSENEDEDEIVFSDVGLKVSFVSEQNANFYVIRTLEIEDLESGESKQVLQFHYTTWPDFGVPESPEAFLDFLFAVRKSGVLEKTVGPAVIHCSAGIGRSGTFCLVDTCLVMIEKNQDPDSISVCDVLMEMRQYRMGLIQTPDQLRFSYMAIIEGCKLVLPPSSVDSGIDDNHLCQSSSSGSSSLPTDVQMSEVTDDLSDCPPSTPPPLPPRSLSPTDNNNPPSIKTPAMDDIMADQSAHKSSSHSDNSDTLGNSHTTREDCERLSATGGVGNGRTDHRVDEDEGISNELLMEKFMDMAGHAQRQESSEIRRRNREERKKRTAEQIARMKEKQKQSESSRQRKQQLSPYMLGISLAVLVGSYIMYRYYTT